jgi:AP-1 complex subunit gamma-1
MLELAPQYIVPFRRVVPGLVRILKSLVMSGYAPEHDIAGLTDPFLQVKILRLLGVLGAGSPEASEAMSDMLAQVATNTEASKTAGNAILLEAVNTVMRIAADAGLRVLAVNILGRFLANRDNNIRYVALETLSRVVATDLGAVQRHRATVVECLKDPDVSIRRRALELAYALINKQNVRALVRELLAFLVVADPEFKPDLVTRICIVVEKFAPDARWHVDTVVAVLAHAGDYARDEVPAALVSLIAADASLHAYAVRRLFRAVATERSQSLVRVGAWCIGEFGEHLVGGASREEMLAAYPPAGDDAAGGAEDVVGGPVEPHAVLSLLSDIMGSTASTGSTREYVLTALVKLTARVPAADREAIAAALKEHTGDPIVEVQQRACEYTRVVALPDQGRALLEPMPVPERRLAGLLDADEGSAETAAASSSSSSKSDAKASKGAKAKAAAPAAAKVPAASRAPEPAVDLLGLDMGSTPAAGSGGGGAGGAIDLLGGGGGGGGAAPQQQQQQQQQQQAAPLSDANMLLDLLGSGPTTTSAAAAAPVMPNGNANVMDLLGGGAPAPAAAAPAGAIPTITGFQKDGLTVTFDCAKVPGSPHLTTITATFVNAAASPLTGFTFLAAVPKYLKMQLQPASAPVVPAAGASKVTQVIKVANSMQGQKPLMLRIKIEFDRDGVHHTEQGQVDNFPQGV